MASTAGTRAQRRRGVTQGNLVVSSARLAGLFPDGIAAAELCHPGDPALLFPEEARHVRRAVAKRVNEFAAGRMCARHALARLGILDVPLGVMEDRRPRWPSEIVGSITHTDGFCGAVVAERARFRSIGVDAEIVDRVTADLLPEICVASERAWVADLPRRRKALVSSLIFAAKEAFYKCQFAVTGEWLDFQDVALDRAGWDPEGWHFTIAPVRELAICRHASLPLTGTFWCDDRLMMAGICLPAD